VGCCVLVTRVFRICRSSNGIDPLFMVNVKSCFVKRILSLKLMDTLRLIRKDYVKRDVYS